MRATKRALTATHSALVLVAHHVKRVADDSSGSVREEIDASLDDAARAINAIPSEPTEKPAARVLHAIGQRPSPWSWFGLIVFLGIAVLQVYLLLAGPR
jgi:hypothetical protein